MNTLGSCYNGCLAIRKNYTESTSVLGFFQSCWVPNVSEWPCYKAVSPRRRSMQAQRRTSLLWCSSILVFENVNDCRNCIRKVVASHESSSTPKVWNQSYWERRVVMSSCWVSRHCVQRLMESWTWKTQWGAKEDGDNTEDGDWHGWDQESHSKLAGKFDWRCRFVQRLCCAD